MPTHRRPPARSSAILRFLLLTTLLLYAAAACALPPTDRFAIAVGGFANSLGLEGRFDGSADVSGTRYDFSEGFDLDARKRLALVSIEWNPLERHQLHITAFEDRRRRTAVVERELVFEDVVFPLQAEVTGRFSVRAIDAGYTWWAYRSERAAAGLGIGVFDYRATFGLSATLRRNGDTEPLVEETVVVADRLQVPVLSASWRYVVSDRLRLRADGSALQIGWDQIDGELYRLQLAAEYYPFEHVGLSIGYARTQLEAEARRRNLRGELELEFTGVQALLRVRY